MGRAMLPARPLWLEIVNGVMSFQHWRTETPFTADTAVTFRNTSAETACLWRRKANTRSAEKEYIVKRGLEIDLSPCAVVL